MFFSYNGSTIEFESQEEFNAYREEKQNEYFKSIGISVPTAQAIAEDNVKDDSNDDSNDNKLDESDKLPDENQDNKEELNQDVNTENEVLESDLLTELKLLDGKEFNDRMWSLNDVELKGIYVELVGSEFSGSKTKLVKELISLIKA